MPLLLFGRVSMERTQRKAAWWPRMIHPVSRHIDL